jgi:hypothetical protein
VGIPVGARRRPRAVWRLAKCGGGSRPVVATSEREGGGDRGRARTGDDKAGVGLFGWAVAVEKVVVGCEL